MGILRLRDIHRSGPLIQGLVPECVSHSLETAATTLATAGSRSRGIYGIAPNDGVFSLRMKCAML
jgi:hypothetical protein